MLNTMHARHIISRFSSTSFRSDQLNFSSFVDKRLMRSLKRAIVEAEKIKTDAKTVSVDVKTRSLINN